MEINSNIPPDSTVFPPIDNSLTTQQSSLFQAPQDQVVNSTSPSNIDLSVYGVQNIALATPTGDHVGYIEWLKHQKTSEVDFEHSQEEKIVFDFLSSRELAEFRGELALSLAEYEDAVNNVGSQQDPVKNQYSSVVDAQNALINAYNAGVGEETSQLAALNQAITDYNSGTIDITAYNTALQTYKNYINGDPQVPGDTGRNGEINTYNATIAGYNSSITSLNADLDLINQQRTNLGLPLLTGGTLIPNPTPTMNQPPATTTIPVPLMTQTRTTLATLPSVNIPSSADTSAGVTDPATGQYVDPTLTDGMDSLDDLNLQFRLNRRNLNKNLDTTTHITQPDSFINEIPAAFISSNVSTGSAQGVNTLNSLSSVTLERSLALGLLKEAVSASGQALSAKTNKQLSAFALQLLSTLGLISIVPGAKLFLNGSTKVPGDSDVAQVSFAISLAKNIGTFTSSNAILSQIKNLIRDELKAAGLSEGQIAQLARQISASINLSLASYAISELSTTLNLPGLLPQVLANTPGIPPEGLSLATQPTVTPSDVLGNASDRSDIQSELSNQLQQSAIKDQEVADRISNDIVDRASSQALQNLDDLKNVVLDQLVEQNIDKQQADSISTIIANFVDEKATARQDEPVAETEPPPKNPLQIPGLTTSTLSPSALSEYLSTSIIAALTPGLGISTAQFIANDITYALLGSSSRERQELDLGNPTSLVNVFKDNMNILTNLENTKVNNQAFSMFRDFIYMQPQMYALMSTINQRSRVTIDAIQGGTSLPSYSPTSYAAG